MDILRQIFIDSGFANFIGLAVFVWAVVKLIKQNLDISAQWFPRIAVIVGSIVGFVYPLVSINPEIKVSLPNAVIGLMVGAVSGLAAIGGDAFVRVGIKNEVLNKDGVTKNEDL